MDTVFKMYHCANHDLEGRGIGLYLINKIIEASGGRVEVESQVGRGTSLRFTSKSGRKYW